MMTLPESRPRSLPFCLGSVIFPASDSVLSQLGVDVKKEGLRCIGIVVEDRNNKAKIYFPQLDMSLWLDHDEMRDIAQENSAQNPAFASLNPKEHPSVDSHPAWIGHWWITQLDPIEILEVQTDQIESLWSHEDGPLSQHYAGAPEQWTFKLSLAIEELDLAHWKSLEASHGDALALARFLPAGMHKLEVQLFLKCSMT